PFQNLTHVEAEARDEVAQVGRQMRGVIEKPLEVVPGRVVEGEARSPSQLGIKVLELLPFQLGLLGQHLLLRGAEHTIKPPQDRERKDDVLVLAALKSVADEVRDSPKEADDLAVIQAVSGRELTK